MPMNRLTPGAGALAATFATSIAFAHDHVTEPGWLAVGTAAILAVALTSAGWLVVRNRRQVKSQSRTSRQ